MASRGWRRRLRATIVVVATLVVVGATVGVSATSNAEDVDRTVREQRNAELVRDAFARGVGDETSFFSVLAEDVQWTVARAEDPRTYTSRSEFLREGVAPIQSRLNGPIQANVQQLITDNDVVVAVWDGTATARDGLPYVNSYTWVMTMRDERVVRASAYLDFVALNALLERVTPQ
ncbi:nuclear transport factor 2 family protein [Mycolicibacterium fluoranthenivorans]|uniref:Nuclear transport factor 2 family protein n=1 Tax=Mycolicibacterium fluoranthenivorans TaxID=258505 RepID=A0A7G8P8C4_9MYCO|nr:nuclear transport factor 2 family protein [Mycolicibacterium fluoranthenivorans]QNJ90590.1 nuclear transport factor 2 family protein [Mycolicibacterium fluoranthenivorans]